VERDGGTWFELCLLHCLIPRHRGMARPQVAGGEDDLQIWRVAVNILNKLFTTADKG
jgi:hypothetical protein